MAQTVDPIPPGAHTLTPYLRIRGAADAIEFYKKAFGAEELCRIPSPDGKIMHAAIQIGDSRLFLSDEFPQWNCPSPQSLGGNGSLVHVCVADVDAAWARAVAAGAKVMVPLQNAFWGDRYGKLADPFGHEWSLASRVEEVSPEETRRRAAAMFAKA